MGSSVGIILISLLAVMQAPLFDGFAFDPFGLFEDGFCSAEVGVGGRDVFQAFVITLVVVMVDERFNLGFEIAGQVVILQQDAVLSGLMPAFDLALGLGMERRPANMAHVFVSSAVKVAPAILWPSHFDGKPLTRLPAAASDGNSLPVFLGILPISPMAHGTSYCIR